LALELFECQSGAHRPTRTTVPTYEYRCKDCGHSFDVVQAFTDDPLTECPSCGGTLKKVFGNVGITFKGSGFYKTDSRSSSSNGGAKKDSSSSDSGSSSSKESSKEPSSSSSKDSGSSSSSDSSKSAAATA
jgi:putative FmdB family regulatory protein